MPVQKRVVLYGSALYAGVQLEARLRQCDFAVHAVDTTDELFDALVYARPDAAVLSLTGDFLEACTLTRQCQEVGRSLIVVVRLGGSMAEAATLLRTGADYAFAQDHFDLFVSSLTAGLRRVSRELHAPTVLELGPLQIDLGARRAALDGVDVALTKTEFEVLRVLAERPGTVLPSGEIMQRVLGVRISEVEAQDLLKVHIHRLRQKLEPDATEPRHIRTVRGHGYMYAFERRGKARPIDPPDSG